MNTKGRTPSKSWSAMFFLYVIFAMNANGRELINRISPYIVDTFNVTADQIGLFGTVSGIGMVLGGIPLARWVEKGGHGPDMKKRVVFMSVGYLLCMCLCGVPGIASTFVALLIFQGLRGVFSSPGETVECSTLTEWWPKEKNGFALGFHHTAYPWGTLVGGLLVTGLLVLVGDEHWQMTFFIFPVLGVLIWLGFWKFSSKKNYTEFEKQCKENELTPPLESVGGAESVKQVPLTEVLKNKQVLLAAGMGFCCQYSLVGYMFWLPLYLAFVAGYSFTASASISLVFTITAGLGQIIWGKLADKIGVYKVLLICFIWLAILFYAFKLAVNGITWIIVLQLLLGCCSNAVYPVIYKRAQDVVPDNANVTGLSIVTTGIFIGAAIATYFTGLLIKVGGGFESVTGYNFGILCMSLVMVVAVILLIISHVIEKKEKKQTTK